MNNSTWYRGGGGPRGRGGPNRGRGGYRGSWRHPGRGSMNYSHQGGNRDNRFNNYNQGRGNQKNTWRRPKRDTPGKRLSEQDIGVTEYISDHPGFTGVIKSRYSDFQVSEINVKGEVAKLTTFAPPQPPVEKKVDEDEDLLLTKYNVEILPLETWDNINKVAVSKQDIDPVEIDASNMSKEQRTKIHDAVKKAFGDSLVSSTVNIGEKKLLRFEKYKKGVRIDNRVKWIWPGEYVYFIVHKENCDTMDAAAQIAERLRINIKPSMLGYAGTKDRRAKTSQWFSLRKVDPRKIAQSCRGMFDVHVGNYSFSNVNLKLGMLKGNLFRIALRNVTADEECVETACMNLRERGFINYYGLQRFGTRVDAPTYMIGVKLLQGNLREAINLVLREREGIHERALFLYHRAGPAAALSVVPPELMTHVEVRLLRALAAAPNDLLGAITKMARNTRLLYLHSYQSLVWNQVVSERLRRFGCAPAVGDLVPLAAVDDENVEEGIDDEDENHESELETENDKSDAEKANNPTEKSENSTENANNSTENAVKTENTDEKSQPDKQGKSVEETPPKPKLPVKVLTQEDVDSGQYTIFDVILPLPGNHIEYPPNMKAYYEELLAKDDLTLDLKHKIKSFSMSGAYRFVVARAEGVAWRFVRYDDPTADLIQSDLAEIHEREPEGAKEDGKYKALLLTMSLPASCYATMALRELMKADTSAAAQARGDQYYRNKDVKTEEGEEKAEGTEASTEEFKAEESVEVKEESNGENGVEKRKLDEDEPSNEVESKKLKTDE